MKNLFIENLNPEYKQKLINTRETVAFADSLVAQLKQAFILEAEEERTGDRVHIRLREIMEPCGGFGRRLSGNSFAYFTIDANKLTFKTTRLREERSFDLLGGNQPDCMRFSSFKSLSEKDKAKVTKLLAKLGKPLNAQTEMTGDANIQMEIARDGDTLQKQVRAMIRLLSYHGFKVRMESVG